MEIQLLYAVELIQIKDHVLSNVLYFIDGHIIEKTKIVRIFIPSTFPYFNMYHIL